MNPPNINAVLDKCYGNKTPADWTLYWVLKALEDADLVDSGTADDWKPEV